MSKKKKKKKFKKHFKAQILQNLNHKDETSDSITIEEVPIQKDQPVIQKRGSNQVSNDNKIDETPTTDKTEMKYFKSDLGKIAFSVGLVIVLFAVVVLLNSQTLIIADITNKLTELAHIN